MADIESNIGINIDTSEALAGIKNLQREISAFHSAMAKGNAKAQAESAGLQRDLLNNLNATGKFAATIQKISTTTESFTNALEKNKLSMREYYRYARGASKNFANGFGAEMATIDKVARERVKDLQSQYVQLGRDASGAMKALKVRPLVLDMNDLGTQTQIAAQKQQIFNQLLKQGSTNLLNFGKNTQWAGRQLMVGFTIPLSIFGTKASQTFMDLEKQAIKFKRVYGDLFTSPAEADKMIADLQKLSLEFTKYGVAVEDTMSLAADAAAMGKTGADLLAQVSEANRLAVLGNVEQSQALETTISVANAFGVAAEDLAGKIDFLNAVENQTVTSIEDLTIAIPKAGPVIQQLGGSVEDLAFFLTAMKEGGINASEGANALKSGLAAIINPTGKATEMLSGFGINLKQIVADNAGNAKQTIIDFATALDRLDPLNRAQAIEQLFGKFQFARISTLFQNVISEGTQAQRVLELSNSTAQQLAQLSSQELGNVAESTTYKFEAAIEKLKVSIAPIGEQFLKAITPLIEGVTKILDGFNSMGDGVKNFVVIGSALIAGLGPVFLMTFGLIANGVANIIKGFAAVRGRLLETRDSSEVLGEQISYMTQEQLNAASVAASLEQTHMQLQQRFTSERAAVDDLTLAYKRAIQAQQAWPAAAAAGKAAKRFANGGMVRGPGGPKSDSIPANLSNGEAVIDAETVKENPGIIAALLSGQKIKLPGFADGGQIGNQKSAFNGKMIMLPGGAQLGHFSDSMTMAAGELLRLAKESNASSREIAKISKMIEATGLDKEIKVFDSRVERVSEELNQMVGDVGSGKTAPSSLVKRDLVDRGRDARMPIIDRMVKAGISPEDSIAKADKITAELEKELIKLGDSVQLTAEDINKLTQRAYEKVAETDNDIKSAYDSMKKFESYTDPTTGRGGKGQRESFSQGYIKQRERIKRQATAYGAKSYGASAFKTTKEMESLSGLSSKEIQAKFKLLSDQQKLQVYAELKNGTDSFIRSLMDATGDAVVTAVKDVTKQASPSKEAYEAGKNIGIGALNGLKEVIAKARKESGAASQAQAQGAIKGADFVTKKNAELIARLNKEWQSGTKLIIDGISSSEGKFKIVGQSIVDQISKSAIARAKTVEATKALFSNGVAGNLGSAPTVGNAFNLETRKKEQDIITATTKSTTDLNSKITAATGIFSGLSMITSVSGVDLGEFGTVVTNVSTLLFSLSLITQALASAKMKELFATKGLVKAKVAEKAKPLIDAVLGAKANAGGKILSGGFVSSLKNIGGLFSNIGVALKTMWSALPGIVRLLGPIAIAFGAMLSITNLVNRAKEDERKAIEGLGKASNFTTDKLDTLASMTGTAIRQNPFSIAASGMVMPTNVKSTDELNQVVSLAKNEDFLNTYQEEISAISNASLKDATLALKSLSIQLYGSGFESDAISNIINALQTAAGRNDVVLDFNSIGINTGNIDYQSIVNDIKVQISDAFSNGVETQQNVGPGLWEAFTGEVGLWEGLKGQFIPEITTELTQESQTNVNAIAGNIKSVLEGLSGDFTTGKIDIIAYNEAYRELMSAITTSNVGEETLSRLFTLINPDVDISKVKEMSDQIAILQALVAGVDVNSFLPGIAEGGPAREKALADMAIAASGATQKIVELNTESSKELDTTAIDGEITALQNQKTVYDTLIGTTNELTGEKVSEAEAYAMATDEKWNALVLDAIEKGNLQELLNLREEYNAAIDAQPTEPPPTFQDHIDDIETEIQGLKDNAAEQKKLEDAGYSTAEAQQILANSMWSAAFAAASTAEEVQNLKDRYAEYLSLLPADNSGGGGGGTPKKSPYQEGIDQLKQQREEILNNKEAYAKLREENVNIRDAYDAASDPVLAAAISATTVGTKKWKELLDLVRKVNKEQLGMDIADQTRQNNIEIQRINNVGKIEEGLAKAGYSSDTIARAIDQIGDNPDLLAKMASDLKDGELDAKNLVDLLKSIDGIEIAINLNKSATDLRNDALEAVGVLNDYFSTQESLIRDAFATGEKVILDQTDAKGAVTKVEINAGKVNTKQLEKDIAAAEEYIASRNYQIDDYQYQLDLIAKKEDTINKKYDDQIAALDDIASLNEDISAAKKSQLDIADALTSGDIAAAARALQEERARKAQELADRQKQNIEKRREKELSEIKSESGLTRIELEKKISNLQDEITKKEEETLEPKKRALDLANQQIESAISNLTYLGKNADAWKLIEDKIHLANIELQKYADLLKAIADGTFDPNNPKGTGGAGGESTNFATGNTAKGKAITYTEIAPGVGQASTEFGKSNPVNLGLERTLQNGDMAYRSMRGESVEDVAARLGVDPSQIRLAGDASNTGYLNNNQLIYVMPKAEDTKPPATGGNTTPPATGGNNTPSQFSGTAEGNKEWAAADPSGFAAQRIAEEQAKLASGTLGPGARAAAEAKIAEYEKRLATGGLVARYAMGGRVLHRAAGGSLFRPFNTDTVPAMLTPGEFVIKRSAVEKYGVENLRAINRGTASSGSVYNYSVNVNVATDANPDRIAREVIYQIKQVDGMRIRGNRF